MSSDPPFSVYIITRVFHNDDDGDNGDDDDGDGDGDDGDEDEEACDNCG